MGKMFMKVPKTSPKLIRESRRRPAQLTFVDLRKWMRNTLQRGWDYFSVRDEGPFRRGFDYNTEYEKYLKKKAEHAKASAAAKLRARECAINSEPGTSAGPPFPNDLKELAEEEIQVAPETAGEENAKGEKNAKAAKNQKGKKVKEVEPENQNQPKEKKKKNAMTRFFLSAFGRFKKS